MGAFSLHVFDYACSRASDECRKEETALSFYAREAVSATGTGAKEGQGETDYGGS